MIFAHSPSLQNLRHRLRGLRAFVVEESGLSERVLAVVRAVAAEAVETGDPLDASALQSAAVAEAVGEAELRLL